MTELEKAARMALESENKLKAECTRLINALIAGEILPEPSLSLLREIMAPTERKGEPVAYREKITGRLCAPEDTHRRKFPMCYEPLYTSPQVPEDTDPLQGAVNWLCEARMDVSVDLIQHKLHIGYNRAKRLFDAARKGE